MVESSDHYPESIYALRDKVYTEPTSPALRPDIVRYVQLCINYAKQLSENELLHGKGANPAADICGALAWQGAEGVDGNDWITEKDEPTLFKMLNLACTLDIDHNNPAAWHELFEAAEHLR